MVDQTPEMSMEDVIRRDGRYPPEAFAFLHESLPRAVKDSYGEDAPEGTRRHVTGAQLCRSLRDAAIERWGHLAKMVMTRWNINSTLDFGNMVYLLIENKFMSRTDDDSLEDFRDVYDFERAFEVCDEFELTE